VCGYYTKLLYYSMDYYKATELVVLAGIRRDWCGEHRENSG